MLLHFWLIDEPENDRSMCRFIFSVIISFIVNRCNLFAVGLPSPGRGTRADARALGQGLVDLAEGQSTGRG